MPQWVSVASVEDCPPGTGIERVAGDQIVAIFNIQGQYYALDGVCPHQGGPLGGGYLHGCIVTCPWHGWRFDIKTAECDTMPGENATRIPIEVIGDEIRLVQKRHQGH